VTKEAWRGLAPRAEIQGTNRVAGGRPGLAGGATPEERVTGRVLQGATTLGTLGLVVNQGTLAYGGRNEPARSGKIESRCRVLTGFTGKVYGKTFPGGTERWGQHQFIALAIHPHWALAELRPAGTAQNPWPVFRAPQSTAIRDGICYVGKRSREGQDLKERLLGGGVAPRTRTLDYMKKAAAQALRTSRPRKNGRFGTRGAGWKRPREGAKDRRGRVVELCMCSRKDRPIIPNQGHRSWEPLGARLDHDQLPWSPRWCRAKQTATSSPLKYQGAAAQ